MRIIDGVTHGERVETLLELEDLVELTSEGFGPVRIGTLETVAARLRADDLQGSLPLSEAADKAA